MTAMKYKRWKVTVKEVGKIIPITTEYHGVIDRDGVIKFFGLENDDVEWFKVEELPWEDKE